MKIKSVNLEKALNNIEDAFSIDKGAEKIFSVVNENNRKLVITLLTQGEIKINVPIDEVEPDEEQGIKYVYKYSSIIKLFSATMKDEEQSKRKEDEDDDDDIEEAMSEVCDVRMSIEKMTIRSENIVLSLSGTSAEVPEDVIKFSESITNHGEVDLFSKLTICKNVDRITELANYDTNKKFNFVDGELHIILKVMYLRAVTDLNRNIKFTLTSVDVKLLLAIIKSNSTVEMGSNSEIIKLKITTGEVVSYLTLPILNPDIQPVTESEILPEVKETVTLHRASVSTIIKTLKLYIDEVETINCTINKASLNLSGRASDQLFEQRLALKGEPNDDKISIRLSRKLLIGMLNLVYDNPITIKKGDKNLRFSNQKILVYVPND